MHPKLEAKGGFFMLNGLRNKAAWAGRLIRRHWKSILYYGGVAIVLSAVAYAAEVYRTDEPVEEMILPAAEIQLSPQEEVPALFFPEGMEIIRGFSACPEWNSALEQWESHAALDCSFKENEVIALSDGEVLALGTGIHGNYIEIDGGNLILRYCSVSPVESLKAGDKVKAGERIGIADESMAAEAYLGLHLHLEAIYNGKTADPRSFMRKENELAGDS